MTCLNVCNNINIMHTARIPFQGACYHVILPGNGGQDISFDEEDNFLLELPRYIHNNLVLKNKMSPTTPLNCGPIGVKNCFVRKMTILTRRPV